MPTTEDYINRVNAFESGLRDCAKKSIEAFSQQFLDGRNKHEYFSEELKDEHRAARLAKRTPLQIERDRIL